MIETIDSPGSETFEVGETIGDADQSTQFAVHVFRKSVRLFEGVIRAFKRVQDLRSPVFE